MHSVFVTRWINQNDLEAALAIVPAGMTVRVPSDMDLFAHEGIAVEWRCDFTDQPTGTQQSDAMMSVTNGLRRAGIEILHSANSVTAPQPPPDEHV